MRSSDATRLGGLQRFAVGITVLNLFGYGYLGFESPILQPLVALLCAYLTELGLEAVESRTQRRPPRFLGNVANVINFLLPAHITALAVSMLLFSNGRLLPIVFATITAIASKYIIRVPIGDRWRHVLNPSNFGIAVTLLLFPSVGIAPPYQFTENFSGAWHWLVPAIVIITGTFINFRFTGRLPLIAAWLAGFALQATARIWVTGAATLAPFVPMTGAAFVLFTVYMITDPSTTPSNKRLQIVFGLSVAAVYGLLTASHVAFGLFFALTIVCSLRGAVIVVRRGFAMLDGSTYVNDRVAGGATPLEQAPSAPRSITAST